MRWSLPVTMTARVRRPLVASTSFVLPLALSIRRFTGRESSATIATICSATTTLPCPTFTRCVPDPPPPFARLFKVLRLLPHLLDYALGGERRLAELEVVGLGADGVDLAIQLLDQEIQRPADRTALVEERPELVEVHGEPCHLLAHIGLPGPDRHLGHEATLVDHGLAEERGDPLAEPLLVARQRRRRARGDGVDLRAEGPVQRQELGAEGLALGRAAGDELVERPAEHIREHGPPDTGRWRLGLLHQTHDARALEHPRERHVVAETQGAPEITGLRDVLRSEPSVDSDLLRGLARRRRELHGHIDAAALETGLDQTARVHLEGRERARQAERDVQMAMVDGASLSRYGHAVPDRLGPAEPRHAAKSRDGGGAGRCHPAIIGRNLL